MGDRIGYARVSTKEPHIDSQIDQPAKAGCLKVMTVFPKIGIKIGRKWSYTRFSLIYFTFHINSLSPI